MPASMKAFVFDGPAPDARRSRVTDVPVPQPGPGEVAVDVRYAGVNFKDVMSRRGDPGYVDAWPFVPGMEVAGTVRALGVGVDSFAVGDLVVAYTGSGGLAEVAIASAQLVTPIPDGLSLQRATAAPGALTTAALLLSEVGRVRPGEAVLVHSAGGAVGQAVAKLARLANVGLVLGTVGGPDRVEVAERSGYDLVYLDSGRLAHHILQRD